MKPKSLLSVLAIGVALCTGVINAAEPADEAARFAKGFDIWLKLKAECGGNYAYQVRWSSAFGFGHVTEIKVRGNKVVERRYEATSDRPQVIAPGETEAKPAGDRWVETGEAIGSHKQGAPAKTLDELYAEAKAVAEMKLKSHQRRYLRFDERGLPISCFWIDIRIADDAPTNGLRISKIELAAPEQDGADGGSKIAEQFLLAVKAEDAAALAALISVPFLDGGEIAESADPLIADFKTQFERKDFTKITGKVTDVLSFDTIKSKLSGAKGDAMRRLLKSGDELVTLQIDFADGKKEKLLVLVSLQQPKAKIVGLLDAR